MIFGTIGFLRSNAKKMDSFDPKVPVCTYCFLVVQHSDLEKET